MLRGILDALASVVAHACESERHGVSLFVLGDESDQPAADLASPTRVGCFMAGGQLETKG
jgi:hypothetical protein